MSTIVLFGVKGSGKDTIGNLLNEQYRFHRDSFAAPLKQMVELALNFEHDDLYGPSEKRETEYKLYPKSEECLVCNQTLVRVEEHRFTNLFKNAGPSEKLGCLTCGALYPEYLTPRISLKTLGTEWGRRLYKHIWTDKGFARARSIQIGFPGTNIVFTDGRFISEHERSVRLGAKTVLLLRKLEESTDTHPSEAEVKLIPRESFHYILDNRCDLSELPSLIGPMLDTLGVK